MHIFIVRRPNGMLPAIRIVLTTQAVQMPRCTGCGFKCFSMSCSARIQHAHAHSPCHRVGITLPLQTTVCTTAAYLMLKTSRSPTMKLAKLQEQHVLHYWRSGALCGSMMHVILAEACHRSVQCFISLLAQDMNMSWLCKWMPWWYEMHPHACMYAHHVHNAAH